MAKGIRSASSIIEKMKYQPTKQLESQRFAQQEGMDNKAVSQRDRFLGKQVASEQQRFMELDKVGEEISMRKDKLSFNKKITGEKIKLAQQEQKLKEDSFNSEKMSKGIEFGLGMISTPIAAYNRFEASKQNKLYTQQLMKNLKLMNERTSDPTEEIGKSVGLPGPIGLYNNLYAYI